MDNLYEMNFFFRAREQNANIYRIEKGDTSSGTNFRHIGVVVYHNEKIRLNDADTLTPEEEEEIRSWLARYKERKSQIDRMRTYALIHEINLITQWIQSEASDEEIVEVFEELVMSITDLRQTAVRRYSRIVEKISYKK